jgi:hypothetical protein
MVPAEPVKRTGGAAGVNGADVNGAAADVVVAAPAPEERVTEPRDGGRSSHELAAVAAAGEPVDVVVGAPVVAAAMGRNRGAAAGVQGMYEPDFGSARRIR